jgi:hypothetical protein
MKYFGDDLERQRDGFILDCLLKRGPSGIKLSDGLGQHDEILLAPRVGMSPTVCQTTLIIRQAILPSERAVIPEGLERYVLQADGAGPYGGML